MTARVLVVDDVPANCRLLEAKLLNEYYEVALAGSGPEALSIVTRWMPDVVLLDVMMPGMDGYEVCRRLKAGPETSHVPIVMVTALTDQAERVRGLQAGADDFLSKPVDDGMLFARLRALLRMKQVLDAWRLRAETARDLGIEAKDAPPTGVAGARALVVNADPLETERLSAVLRQDGLEVATCVDPAEAWAALLEEPHDLVLLSLSPDGGDSLRFASRLRAEALTRELPVLLIGDQAHKSMVLRGFDLGANDHVLRPVDPNELCARVRNQVRRKHYQDMLRADLDRSLELAVTDPLTGLRNRRYVRRHLEGVLRNAAATALMLDVDRFKSVNDTFGHAAGDVVLREVSDRVRSHLRSADVVARYGGEEFLVVMSGAGAEETAVIAERLRAAIADRPIDLGQAKLPVTVSVGSALAANMTDAEALIAAADVAMYRAKSLGRNRVEAAIEADWRA